MPVAYGIDFLDRQLGASPLLAALARRAQADNSLGTDAGSGKGVAPAARAVQFPASPDGPAQAALAQAPVPTASGTPASADQPGRATVATASGATAQPAAAPAPAADVGHASATPVQSDSRAATGAAAAGPTTAGAQPAAGADALDALATADVALIDEELAEHQRWGAAAARAGAAGSATRARFLSQQADAGIAGGGAQALAAGAGMGAATRAAEIAGSRAAIRLAGQVEGRVAPIPAIGAVIGGVMSAMDLAERDWDRTGQTIGRFGQGSSDYETLANSIAAVSEIISVYTSVLNVIAGTIGAISIAMWAITVATVGVAAPLAGTLSTIAAAIGIGTMILDAINALVLQPLVMTLRALHTFKSQADPTEIEEQGGQVRQAAAAGAGFVGGFAGGMAGTHGVGAAGRRLGVAPPHAPPTTHETPPAAAGDGPVIHAELPEGGMAGEPAATGAEPAHEPSLLEGESAGLRRITDEPAGVQAPAAEQLALPGLDLAAPAPAAPSTAAPAASAAAARAPVGTGRLEALWRPLKLVAMKEGQPVPTGVQRGAIGTYGKAVANPHPAALLSNPPGAPGATLTGGKMPSGVRASAGVFAEHQTAAAIAGEVVPNYEYQASGGRPRSGQDVREGLTISLPVEAKSFKDNLDNALLAEVRQRQAAGQEVPIIEIVARGAEHVQQAVARPGAAIPEQQIGRMFLAEVDQFNSSRYGNVEVRPGEPLPAGHPFRDVSVEDLNAHVDRLFEPFVAPEGTQLTLPGMEVHAAPARPPAPEQLSFRFPDPRQLALPFGALRQMSEPVAGRPTGGLRNTEPLSSAQQASLLEMVTQMGYPPDAVHFYGGSTGVGYGDLFIGPDVYPHPLGLAAGGVNPANRAIGARGALGHEIIGHIQAEQAGQTRLEDWHEEFQASTRGALLTPGLAPEDVRLLSQDAAARRRHQTREGTIFVWTEPVSPAGSERASPTRPAPPEHFRLQDQLPSVIVDWAAAGLPPPEGAPAGIARPSMQPAPGSMPPGSVPRRFADGGGAGLPGAASASAPAGVGALLGSRRHGYAGAIAAGLWSAVPRAPQVQRVGRIGAGWFGDERLQPPTGRDSASYSRAERNVLVAGGGLGTALGALAGGPLGACVGQRVGEGVARRGADFAGGLVRGMRAPIVERVSPAYPAPPEGGYDQINALQERLARILAARAQAEAVEQVARADADHHRANAAPLAGFDRRSTQALAATEAHQAATQRRQQANMRRQELEGDVSAKLADAAQRRSGLSVLTVPLSGLRRFSSLGDLMPDGVPLYPAALVEPKRKIRQLNRDATDFLNALNGIDHTIDDERARAGTRRVEADQHGTRLGTARTGAAASVASMEDTRTQGQALARRNQQRVDESRQIAGDATLQGARLDGEAQRTQAQMQTAGQRWQAWAQAHRQARLRAIEQRRQALAAQGYEVREVRER